MVRRPAVDRSPQQVMYDADSPAGSGDLAPAYGSGAQGGARGWRGAGGRWLVWVFRGVAWLVLLVIGYRGVTAIVLGETAPGPSPAVTHSRTTKFPVTLAGAYALQFGQVYLNADPANAQQRARELSTFLPAGSDQQFGWNGKGTLQLESEQVADIQVEGAHHAVVKLLARVSGRLMQLGVPIYASGGKLVISGEPAWLPVPARASLPSSSQASSDQVTQAVLMKQLPAFFQAYASGNQATLSRFLAPGTSVSGLGGQVVFGSLSGVTVPAGGRNRHVIATVRWRVPGPRTAGDQSAVGPSSVQGQQVAAGLEMSYALTITNRGGTWYISHIGAPSLGSGP